MEKFGSGMEKFGSRMEKFGSGTNIPDPQHCYILGKDRNHPTMDIHGTVHKK
jgi:hypothetical protein